MPTNGVTVDVVTIILGNTDTQTSVLRVLDGAIIAKNIRLIPVSEGTRTVCMRVEVHGCTYRDTLQSYTIPQGSHIDGLELRDLSYDGDERDDGKLINGIGKLFDGVLGSDNFEVEPGAWIGWHKNDVTINGGMISAEFRFNERRNFTAISLHTSNFRKLGAQLFSEAVILFSTSDDDLYSSRIVKFEQQPDFTFETSRWVRIPINSRLAKKLRIDLTFGDSAEYLLISEIKFESNNVAFRLPDTIDDDTTDSILTIDSQNAIEIISSNTASKQTTLETFIYILLPFSLAVMFLIALACYLLLPRHARTPMKAFQSKPLMGEYYDQQCCGTSSRSNASTKRYAPTPEKLSYDDSEYADPDIEAGQLAAASSKHYATTNLLQSQYSFAPTNFW
uniref:F5/8 type C domain-containing protein n=1 Tax=Panagrolaimus superbus TaxID=310955 RepID=A0A914Y7Y0_9BILA